jgi:hypothetical protein
MWRFAENQSEDFDNDRYLAGARPLVPLGRAARGEPGMMTVMD